MLKMKGKYDIQMIDFTRGEGGLGNPSYLDGTTAVTRMADEREGASSFFRVKVLPAQPAK